MSTRAPVRLCIVAPSAYPLGGVAVWLDALVPGLRARGCHVDVLLSAGRYHDAAAYRRAHPHLEPVEEVDAGTATSAGRRQALEAALRALRADVVLSMNVPEALLAAAAVRSGDGDALTPAAVMVLNGLEPDLYGDAAKLEPLIDAVLCSNRLCQALLDACGGPGAARQWYTPYGVAPAAGNPPATVEGPLRIGFAGRFERFQKRIQDLPGVEAALARRGIPRRWVIAGAGADADPLRELGAHGTAVTQLGEISRAAMAERFFREIDVLLVTSFWETGPIVAWEALGAGVTLVSSRYVGSGLEGSLRDGENCRLFPIGDTEAAAAAIAQLVDPAARRRLAHGADRLLRSRYDLERCIDGYAEALRAVAAGPRRTRSAPAPEPAGRLDRWLGVRAGERVRRLSQRRGPVVDAGDEWPHTLSCIPRDDAQFWRCAGELDVDPQPCAPAPQCEAPA